MNIFASVAPYEDDINRFKPGELSLSLYSCSSTQVCCWVEWFSSLSETASFLLPSDIDWVWISICWGFVGQIKNKAKLRYEAEARGRKMQQSYICRQKMDDVLAKIVQEISGRKRKKWTVKVSWSHALPLWLMVYQGILRLLGYGQHSLKNFIIIVIQAQETLCRSNWVPS